MSKDPQQALELVPSIGLPNLQAEVLGEIAGSLGDRDPAQVRSVVNRAEKLLKDVKDNPSARLTPWIRLAEAAHRIQDDTQARDYLERALDDAVEL
jgi:acetyl-CoA carboxylase alpha subunit